MFLLAIIINSKRKKWIWPNVKHFQAPYLYSKTWLIRTPTGLSKSVRFSEVSGLNRFTTFSYIFWKVQCKHVCGWFVDRFMANMAEDICLNLSFISQSFNTWKPILRHFTSWLYSFYCKCVYFLFIDKK